MSAQTANLKEVFTIVPASYRIVRCKVKVVHKHVSPHDHYPLSKYCVPFPWLNNAIPVPVRGNSIARAEKFNFGGG